MKRELEEERIYRSLSMSAHSELLGADPNECMICLDDFTAEAPCIPTVCGCGVNKSRFHLACLQHYKASRGHLARCPICEEPINFDEV